MASPTLKPFPPSELFTLSVHTENTVGVLNSICNIFTRRGINVEDISAGDCSTPGLRKITITAWSDRPTMEKVAGQIEKIIAVVKVQLFTDADIVFQEVALYKVPTSELLREVHLEHIIRQHSARILDITPEYVVIERTGHSWEIEALFKRLRPYGLRQFTRSGRICVTRSTVETIDAFLQAQERRKVNGE